MGCHLKDIRVRNAFPKNVLNRELIEKLSFPVTETGCWIWTGPDGAWGYGSVGIDYKQWRAHRASWHAFNGPIPDGLHVLHKCDVRLCVNPAHLFLGTHTDNMRDCLAKGRFYCGVRHQWAKLDEHAVRQIRAEYALPGANQYQIARRFGVQQGLISQIVNRRIWAHVQ